jgi:uncharacterized protein
MDEQITSSHRPAVSSQQASNRLLRWLWLGAGFLLLGVGILGIILPLLPTTVFFIGAAACFARSSPRFEQWVLNLPQIGPLVRDYRSGLGMRRRAKGMAITTMLVVIGLSSIAIPSWPGRLAAYALALFGIWYIMQRVPTREHVLAKRDNKQ